MQVQSGHFAASSSPMYGGGPRWGTNDVICALSPIPAFPREAGEGDAATCSFNTRIVQVFLPHVWGRTEVGDKRPRT